MVFCVTIESVNHGDRRSWRLRTSTNMDRVDTIYLGVEIADLGNRRHQRSWFLDTVEQRHCTILNLKEIEYRRYWTAWDMKTNTGILKIGECRDSDS